MVIKLQDRFKVKPVFNCS